MSYKDPEQQRAYQKAYRERHKKEMSAYQKLYQKEHSEILAAYAKAYAVNHRAQIALYSRRYQKAHAEKVAKRKSAFYKTHRDKIQAYHRAYYKKYRAKIAARARIWQATHGKQRAALSARRRAHLARAAGWDYTTAEHIKSRWAMWGDRCYICGAPAEATDHVMPLARGGSHWPANLRPICTSCNSRKGARPQG